MKVKSIDEYLKGGLIQDSKNQSLNAIGWYRIAVAENSEVSVRALSYGKNLLISITRIYSTTDNEAYLISLTGAYYRPNFKVLNSAVKSRVFDKIRYVISGNKIYIEVHYSRADRNGALVGIYGQSRFSSLDPVFVTLPFEPSDNTGEVLAESDL